MRVKRRSRRLRLGVVARPQAEQIRPRVEVANVRARMRRVDAHLHHVNALVGHQLGCNAGLMGARQLGLRDAIGEEAVLLALRDLEPALQRLPSCPGLPSIQCLGVRRAQRRTLQPGRLCLPLLDDPREALAGLGIVRQLAQVPGQVCA